MKPEDIGATIGKIYGRIHELITARGGQVTRAAGPMKHGTTVIAFVEDPDGYSIELIQP